MQTLIRLIERNSGDLLAEYQFDESDKAYNYASILEQEGLEVDIRFPTITETMANSLGVKGEREKEYEESIEEELSAHDGTPA